MLHIYFQIFLPETKEELIGCLLFPLPVKFATSILTKECPRPHYNFP